MQIFNNKFFNSLYSCGSSVLQGISTGLGHVWKHLSHAHSPLLISPSSYFYATDPRSRIIDRKLDSLAKKKIEQFKELQGDDAIEESQAKNSDFANLFKIIQHVNELTLENSNYGVFTDKINAKTISLLNLFLKSEHQTTPESLAYFKTIFSYLIEIRNEKDQEKRKEMLQTLYNTLITNYQQLTTT